MKGTVTFFKDFSGYGFVAADDGNNYFVHISQIRGTGYRTLAEGQQIQFTPGTSHRGPVALNVTSLTSFPTDRQSLQPSDTDTTIIKKNPFTPQDPIVDPTKFVGRKESLINAIDAVYNGRNILIDGHRGIGKSSLALQLLYVTEGESELLDRFGIDLGDFNFDHVTGDHRCLPGNTLPDIVNGLVATLYYNLGKFSQSKTTTTTLRINTKVVDYEKSTQTQPISPSDISLRFVQASMQALKDYAYQAQGLTFLIDEIDVLQDTIDMASFLKATIEKFRLDSYFSVNFIVCGVTGTATRLIMQHPSSLRLFERLTIPRMSTEELEEIVDAALRDAGQITITPLAKNRIARLANEFPQPVHLLGYHSYRLDTDNRIDNSDLQKAVRFVVTNVRSQHFQSKFDNVETGLQTLILRAMASVPNHNVYMPYLLTRLPEWDERQILQATNELCGDLDILDKVHSKGYAFREPLFKVYLRLLFKMDA